MELNQWSLKRWLLAGMQLVIILLIVFGKWLGYDIYISAGSATLLKVGSLMKRIATNICSNGGGGLMFIAVLIYLLLVIGASMTWRTVSNLFRSKTVSIAGYLFGVILFACMFLLITIANAALSSETDGWIDNVFKLHSAAYWTLALSIAGWVICIKMPATVGTGAAAHPVSAPSAHAGSARAPIKHCVSAAAWKGLRAAASAPPAAASLSRSCTAPNVIA